MKIYLLTHEREQRKPSNTGALVAGEFVTRIPWQRTNPNEEILKLSQSKDSLLLYPTTNDCDSVKVKEFENLIIIDGTWQESRKIFNKSDYLQSMPRATINANNESTYKLRRR